MQLHTIKNQLRRSGVLASFAFAAMAGVTLTSAACAQSQGQSGENPQHKERGEGRGERRDPQQMIDHRISELTQSLQLNADQQSKIRAILTDERTQMDALRQKNGLQRPEDRGQRPDGARPDSVRGERGGRGGHGPGGFGGRNMPPEVKALHDKTNQRIEGVLNSTQLAKYRQLRQEREQERARRDSSAGPGKRAS